MNKKLYIIGALLILFSANVSKAQEIARKSYYTFERLEEITPWLVSPNGSGLVYNTAENNLSNVGGYFNNISGDYRNYNQAKSMDNFGVQTKSYTRIKNLFFYGSFTYDYAVRKDQAWLGTTYENTNINPVLDSIPGKNIREAYILNAKVAYRFSDLFAGGIVFKYNAATSSKRIDGRNKNNFSALYVSPGISFTTRYLNLGLNLNYGHNGEDVEYKYYGEVTNKYLCYMEGLFIYNFAPVNETLIRYRRYEKNIFGGGLQLELKLGNLSFYNNLNADYCKENDYEDQAVKRRYAKVENLTYDYTGILKYAGAAMDNALTVKYRSTEDLSYNIITINEPVPGTLNLWEFYEYGSALRYTSQIRTLTAEYRGFIKKNEYISKVDFTLGFGYSDLERVEKIYPAEYRQENKVFDYYANVNKNFLFGANILKISLRGGFSNGSGAPLTQKDPLTTGLLKLNKGLLAHDYVYRVSDSYRVGAGVDYSYIINKQKGQTLNIGVDYLYRKLTKVKSGVYDLFPRFSALEKSSRSSVSVRLNYNF